MDDVDLEVTPQPEPEPAPKPKRGSKAQPAGKKISARTQAARDAALKKLADRDR